MALAPLPPLGTIDGVESSDTSSPYYLPPTGYYQNDAGEVVPKSVPNTPVPPTPPTVASMSSTSSDSLLNYLNPAYVGTKVANLFGASTTSLNIEDYIFILIGVVLIIAGLFSFRGTQSIIVNTGNAVAKTGRRAAEAASLT